MSERPTTHSSEILVPALAICASNQFRYGAEADATASTKDTRKSASVVNTSGRDDDAGCRCKKASLAKMTHDRSLFSCKEAFKTRDCRRERFRRDVALFQIAEFHLTMPHQDAAFPSAYPTVLKPSLIAFGQSEALLAVPALKLSSPWINSLASA